MFVIFRLLSFLTPRLTLWLDLTQTPADVVIVTVPSLQRANAGEVISAGDLVYKKVSDGLIYKADCNVTSAEAVCAGIALNSALAAGQPVTYAGNAGDIVDPGATVVVGEIYVVSANAGKIAPVADLVSTNFVSIFGVGKTAAQIEMVLKNTGIQKA